MYLKRDAALAQPVNQQAGRRHLLVLADQDGLHAVSPRGGSPASDRRLPPPPRAPHIHCSSSSSLLPLASKDLACPSVPHRHRVPEVNRYKLRGTSSNRCITTRRS